MSPAYTREPNLLPCPFCGSKEVYLRDGPPWWVTCGGCDCDGPMSSTDPDAALHGWNSREQSEIARLQALVDRMLWSMQKKAEMDLLPRATAEPDDVSIRQQCIDQAAELPAAPFCPRCKLAAEVCALLNPPCQQ